MCFCVSVCCREFRTRLACPCPPLSPEKPRSHRPPTHICPQKLFSVHHITINAPCSYYNRRRGGKSITFSLFLFLFVLQQVKIMFPSCTCDQTKCTLGSTLGLDESLEKTRCVLVKFWGARGSLTQRLSVSRQDGSYIDSKGHKYH